MSTWFTSRNSAVTLGIITLLTLMARLTFLDAMYVPEFRTLLPEGQPATIGVVMVVFMVFVGGWIGSLLTAARGSRAGLMVSLIFCLFAALVGGLLTLVFLCPNGCAVPPVGNLIVWANLISGAAASLTLSLQLIRTRRPLAEMQRTMGGKAA